jgi:hypothetical protein
MFVGLNRHHEQKDRWIGRAMRYAEAAQIEDIIVAAPLCAGCIVLHTGMQPWRLNDVLPRLIGALRVASAMGACGACLKHRVVHRLS